MWRTIAESAKTLQLSTKFKKKYVNGENISANNLILQIPNMVTSLQVSRIIITAPPRNLY